MVSFVGCGQSSCDATFRREEGRPAHDPRKFSPREKLIEQQWNWEVQLWIRREKWEAEGVERKKVYWGVLLRAATPRFDLQFT